MKTASWVIKNKATGAIIAETFDPKIVAALNTAKYEAVPIHKHLASLNTKPYQRNPVPPSTKALTTQVDAAKKLYTRFTGHQAEVVGEVDAPEWPEVLNLVGEVFAIEYDTVRDGKYEKYRHEFHKKSRPLFGTSPDGKMLCLIGGSYTFTERGIVDEDSRGKPLE